MSKHTMMGIVFSNMHDNHLGGLTHRRTTGSVPFGGRYRLVDFILSSMVNSGVRDVGVIAKSNYQTLMEHLGSGREWDLSRKIGGLTIFPPYSSGDNQGIYAGRLDALSGVSNYIRNARAEYVILADCDIIANIDFEKIIAYHEEKGAEITLAYSEAFIRQEGNENVCTFQINEDGRVEKVWLSPQLDGTQNTYLNVAVLKKELLETIIHDAHSRNKRSFSKDILVEKSASMRIFAYPVTDCVLRINSVQDYFDANMALLDFDVRKALFPQDRPVLTRVRDQVPAKFGLGAHVQNALVADGCIIEGTVENSIIFRGVKIGRGAVIRNSIIMAGSVIGDGARMEYVVADHDITVRDTRTLMGYKTYPLFLEKGSVI